MSLNKYMHPRNPFYNNPPDFAQLSKLYPEFSTVYKNNTFDFKDPQSLRVLCCVLMKHFFHIDLDVPIDRLIPRVPQRVNYVLWIEDLLERPISARGIDIGCGTSCIYALIACSLNKEWNMTVTDISEENIEWARKNVEKNKLDDRIKIIKVDEDTRLDRLFDSNSDETYDFLMCNPPFYENESEAAGASTSIRKPEKRAAPHSVNTGRVHESVYSQGGEVGFVKKIIDESVVSANKIKVYTSMLGKKKSLSELKKYLKESKISNISETQFCQGRTMRWAIAWSFKQTQNNNEPFALSQFNYFKEKRKKEEEEKNYSIEIPDSYFNEDEMKIETVLSKLKKLLVDDLNMEIVEESLCSVLLEAHENNWSKQRMKTRLEKKGSNVEATAAKRRKLNVEEREETNTTEFVKQILIRFKLETIEKFDGKISVKLTTMENSPEKKETLNQISQYIKNRLKIKIV